MEEMKHSDQVPPEAEPIQNSVPMRQNTRTIRYAIAGAIAFVLMIGLLLLLSQRIGKKKANPVLRQNTQNRTVTPVTPLPSLAQESWEEYKTALFVFSYPASWSLSQKINIGGHIEITTHTTSGMPIRMTVGAITGIPDMVETTKNLYTGLDFDSVSVKKAEVFTSYLQGVTPSSQTTGQQQLQLEQQRIAQIWKNGTIYSIFFAYPGAQKNAVSDAYFLRILRSFLLLQR